MTAIKLAVLTTQADGEANSWTWNDLEHPAFLLPNGTLVSMNEPDEDITDKLNAYASEDHAWWESEIIRIEQPDERDLSYLQDRLSLAMDLIGWINEQTNPDEDTYAHIEHVEEDGSHIAWFIDLPDDSHTYSASYDQATGSMKIALWDHPNGEYVYLGNANNRHQLADLLR